MSIMQLGELKTYNGCLELFRTQFGRKLATVHQKEDFGLLTYKHDLTGN